jgi:oligopeptide/dipeptide ABC transporter ATP-binding protein
MIFQDALRSLNPLLTIRRQVTEGLRHHLNLSRRDAEERALHWLTAMSVPDPEKRLDDHPHQLSGGMRQRVMAAIALACEPDLIIADEPTTAVDVTVQAEILELLRFQVMKRGAALLFITHDFGSVATVCDRVAVMYCGRIVESGDAETVFTLPAHPYTKGLLETVPRIDDEKEDFGSIPGTPPLAGALPAGCSFAARCGWRTSRCLSDDPGLRALATGSEAACHHAEKVLAGAR